MKKTKRLLLTLCVALLLGFFFPVTSSIAKDATIVRVYNLPVCYYSPNAPQTDSLSSGMKTINVVATLSTNTVSKGTVITLTGLPNDASNFTSKELYSVDFAEGNNYIYTEYGGWYNGRSYKNRTITYTVQSNMPVTILFGTWYGSSEGGCDSIYTFEQDGTVSGGCYDANDIDEFLAYGNGFNDYLETFVLNSTEFNALTYYLNNPDLAELYGPNPQDLYNHWITIGKNEDRKAI